MNDSKNVRRSSSIELLGSPERDFGTMAKELCDRALEDARGQLHPLLQNNELDRLDRRREFLQAFKSALEQRIARGLALCQPAIQAVFRYDETRLESIEHWDGSVHLLVKVPRVSNA